MLTPVEEVMSTIDSLVRSGQVRYFGLSDTPAWYAARAQSLAWLRGWETVAALQLEYSLAERNIEREHVPAALHLGLGITPWSPLAGGFLTGKYRRESGDVAGEGRLQAMKDPSNPVFYKFTERNWQILEVLQGVAREMGRSPAQVALNWITRRPGVTSTIIGARDPAQLEDNIGALEFVIPDELSRRLGEASRPELGFPYTFFNEAMQRRVSGGVDVRREPPWFRG
jgi:aryl-alcohol dehydrogenase-like predicted oxidoreductase